MDSSSRQSSLAIVIPAYNAAPFLPRVIPAAVRTGGGAVVLVVDAGSTDSTGDQAAALGARVVRLSQRAGPAEARNVGVARVDASVVLFLDSDCVAHRGVGERVRKAFAADPDLVSLTGSYDTHCPERNFFSQYMNLRHHYTHHVASRENATFWAGCGAVRRSAFLEAGGFDQERYPHASVEDIELGLRLATLGSTRLDPELQVTHLKRWTLRSLVATELARRAVPWSRLMLELGEMPNDLNLRTPQRVAAGLAPFALLSLCAAPLAALAGKWVALLVALAVVSASVALNWGMLRVFARERGAGFAAAGWCFHQVHLVYAAATFAVCALLHRRRARPALST